MNPEIRIKRIYDESSPDDGLRIFVDRLWARGVKKETAQIDLWSKELTPSTELRKWFHEDPSHQPEFAQRYLAELEARSDEIDILLGSLQTHAVITLVTATKDLVHGHAAILREMLIDKL